MNKLTKQFLQKIAAGWIIVDASSCCGGRFAWMKPRRSGAFEMVGCICHTSFSRKKK